VTVGERRCRRVSALESAPTDTVELICIDFIGMYKLDLERAAAAVKMSYVLQRVSISRASAI